MRKVLAFVDFSSVFVLLLFVGFVSYLNVTMLNAGYITHYFNFLSLGGMFVFLAFLIFVFHKISHVINSKNYGWLVFVISIITKLIFIMLVNSKPESDFAMIFKTAGMFADGTIKTLNAGPGSYYDVWAYQSVYTLYQAFVLYVYNSIDALKILNVFFMAGSSVMVYKICNEIYSEKISFIVACLYSLYPEMAFYSPVLSNQHISTFFVLIGVYLLLKNNYRSLVFSGIFLALGDLMRPEIIIIFIAAGFCLIVSSMKSRERGVILSQLAKFSTVVVIYVLIHVFTGAAIKASGVNQYGIDNRNPEWKFMVGLDKEHLGAWNTSHANILGMTDSAERKKEVIDYVKKTYKTPGDVLSFVHDKQAFMWASPSPVYFTFNDGELTRTVRLFGKEYYMNDLVNVFVSLDKVYYTFIFCLFFVSVLDVFVSLFRGVVPSKEQYFIMMVCLVNFLIYLFIEVQPRYKYFVMPFIFIAIGHFLTRVSTINKSNLKARFLLVFGKRSDAAL